MQEFNSYRAITGEIQAILDQAESRITNIVSDAFDQGQLLPSIPIVQGIALYEGPNGGLVASHFGSQHDSLADAMDGVRTPLIQMEVLDHEVLLRAEIPGLGSKDLDIAIFDRQISIRGERGKLRYEAMIDPGVNLDRRAFDATLEDGILQMTCPILTKVVM